MENYTYAQLEGLWINAGGSAATAPLAAAVAWAESAGNPTANSTQMSGTCINAGLWQLATPCGGGAGYSAEQLYDPAVNAAVAVKVSQNGTNWNTWETYVNGNYKAYLNNGTTPDTTGLPTGPTTATLTASTAAGGTCALNIPLIGCILPKSALRGIIGGLCLGAAGILGLTAAVILAASAFEHSGAATAVARAVPPVRAVTGLARRAAP